MHVVVWDPANEYWEGGLVDDETAAVLQARHVATLPIEPKLVRWGAVGGYFRRGWGAGYPIGFTTPAMSCPMVLRVNADHHSIHWCARLVPTQEAWEALQERFEQGGHLEGMLRLSSDSGQPGVSGGGVAAEGSIEVGRLGPPDEHGGWTVGGTARYHGQDGYVGLGLYGTIPGLAVAWAACSQSR